jgi:hypothetical protein
VTNDEKTLLADATTDHAWPLVEHFAQMPREDPDDVNAGGDEIVNRLKALGIPVTIHNPELYLSLPKVGRLEIDGETFEAKPPSFTKPAPDGLEARLVLIGGSSKLPQGYAPNTADMFGAGYDPLPGFPDVKGALAVFHGLISTERVVQLSALGAAGIIAINPGEFTHWGGGCPFWGSPDLDDLTTKIAIPVVAVNKHAGAKLVAAAKEGRSARIFTELREGWFKSRLPVVEIPGTVEPEKFVLLHGHYDSWDVGVGDNATGNAAMVEIARVLWQNRDKLRRGVRLAWWPGHSTGRFGGSTWYADAFAADLMRNCIAQVNCDSPGCRWASSYEHIPWMAENIAFVTGVVRDSVDGDASGRRPPPANDYSFTNLGITGYLSSSSRIPAKEVTERGYYYVIGNGGNIEWHTVHDRMHVADRDILLKDIKLYLLAVFRNANAELLPYDWRALLAEYSQTVAAYQKAAGDRFDLTPVAKAITALDGLLSSFNTAIRDGAIAPAKANTVLLKLSRKLVPLNYARSTAYRRDLALPPAPLPWLAIATELDRYPEAAAGAARTHLLRGSNHVIGELTAAADLVEAALAAA